MISGSSTPVPSAPLAAHYHLQNQIEQQPSPADSLHDLHMKHFFSSRTASAHTLTPLMGGHNISSAASALDHHDADIGVQDAAAHYIEAHEPIFKPISERRLEFEHSRPALLRQCVAEATGVFFFVFCGIASIASFTLHHDHEQGLAAFGSIFQIGWAFAIGVALAIITCAPVSGGHFNPAITLAMAFWQDFPWRKVPYYIISQIIGAFAAGLVLMACYWTKVQEVSAVFEAAGRPLVGGGAPASILCPMPMDSQSLGYLFAVEFFADMFIGICIWAALDPANPFMTTTSIPFVIGLAYASMIWGFGSQTLSTNLARDLGPRMVAAIFFGRDAFTHMGYAPIGMFVNVPATLLATAYYEMWMRDSFAIIGKGHGRHREGDAGLYHYMKKTGILDEEQGVHVREPEKQVSLHH